MNNRIIYRELILEIEREAVAISNKMVRLKKETITSVEGQTVNMNWGRKGLEFHLPMERFSPTDTKVEMLQIAAQEKSLEERTRSI